MAKYILAIDQGTTGTTVNIIHKDGSVVSKVNEEFEQIFPKPGWVEHNPEAIWSSVESCLKKALDNGKIKGSEIAAIGITNQRETVVMWDRKTGKPIYNAIVWQCRRTTEFCEKLKKKKGAAELIKKKTGLVIDPYFSASKIHWLLENVPQARSLADNEQLAVGTIDCYLLWRLTGGEVHKTDVTNASRTQLMNIFKNEWDKDLLKLFDVPQKLLPEIAPSSGVFGETKGLKSLPDGIAISGIAGDQQAALFGQAAFQPGDAKCTFGTGSFLLMNAGTKPVLSDHGLLTTVAWQLGENEDLVYALEGGAFICGAAVQWLRDGLGFIQKSSEIEKLAEEVEDSGSVEFVPALSGLGAPYWDPQARGLITGLTRGTQKAHIARATLEAMALQNVDILEAMQSDLKKRLKAVRVDGGASSNNLLMQFQSDYLGAEIIRPKMIETTSAGAAYLAGLGVGFWKNLEELKKVWEVDKEFQPQLNEKDRKLRLKTWRDAVKRAMWSPDESVKTPKKKKATKKSKSPKSRSKVSKKRRSKSRRN